MVMETMGYNHTAAVLRPLYRRVQIRSTLYIRFAHEDRFWSVHVLISSTSFPGWGGIRYLEEDLVRMYFLGTLLRLAAGN